MQSQRRNADAHTELNQIITEICTFFCNKNFNFFFFVFRVFYSYCVETTYNCEFISVLTNLMHKMCFTVSFISCLYMFRSYVLIIMRPKLHFTASGIITLKQVSGLKLLKYNSINMSK